jgi:large subunit ribosomal protein L4
METKLDEKLDENLERKKKVIGLIHRVYLTQLKNARQYTASTKTKSEVRGGGRKPWKQKGTGRARAGSSRSPLWVGGGVTFGPKSRLVFKKINKKEKRLAIISAFYLKQKEFIYMDENLNYENIRKTKEILLLLKNLKLNLNQKILFVLPNPSKQFWLASRNLKNIEITTVNCLNIKQLLKTNNIVLTKSSLTLINSIYGNHYA